MNIPKLNLDKVPMIPGFAPSGRDRSKSHNRKYLITSTAKKLEYDLAARTNIVTNGTLPSKDKRDFSTTHYSNFGPPKTERPERPVKYTARDRWFKLDRQVLRWYLFFKEAVFESPEENYRVRKCVLYWYLASDTIEIIEPKTSNSGMPQGKFLSSTPAKDVKPDGVHSLRLEDVVVGSEISLYGRTFRVVDCDKKTRSYFANEFGIEQSPAEPYPEDPIEIRNKQRAQKQKKGPGIGGASKPDTLRKFLKYDKKVLKFKALWDDSKSLYGEKRFFTLQYYLSDDNIEIREIYESNSGREKVPQFLNRNKVIRPDGKPYVPRDFVLGTTIVVNGRKFQLLTCDDFTRAFYAKIGIEQTPVIIKKEKKVIPKMPVPPYNGYGTEEDSLGSFYSLVPRPPRKKQTRADSTAVLRFKARFVTNQPENVDRRFVVSFFLADCTLGVFEPVQRNSGFMGGKYLERGTFTNVETGRAFQPEDFRSPLVDGTEIEINNRKFVFLKADDFTKKYFDQYVEEKILSDAEKLFRRIVNAALLRKVDVRSMFEKADKDNSHSISFQEFKILIGDMLGTDILEEDAKAVMSMFSKGRNEVWYNDFCDALATKWTPPSYQSPNRIDQLEEQLAAKLREKKEHMRKLFRQFDTDGSNSLTMSEFQGMLEYFHFKLSPYEIAELMARYDRDREGTIDYNEFCSKVYLADFSYQPKGSKVVLDEAEIDIADYLSQLKDAEESLSQKAKADELLQAFVRSFAERKYQLRKTFREFDKSRDGKIDMNEFFEACSAIHPLNDEEKFALSLKFFPNPDDVLDYETFMDIIFRAGHRGGTNLSGLSESQYTTAK